MKIPSTPPDMKDMLVNSSDDNNILDIERLANIFESSKNTQNNRVYLHWDEFRRRPINGDYSHEEAWLGVKMSREFGKYEFPFSDPHNQPFHANRPEQMFADLRQIDLRAGGTIDVGQAVTNPNLAKRHLRRSIIEEPFSSSVLEGAATTRVRAKAMIEDHEKPETIDDRMVVNNYRAIEFIKAKTHENLTPELILEVHRIISEGTLERPDMAGRLRDNDDVVVEDNKHEVLHVPPTYIELQNRLEKLCAFANQTEEEAEFFIHPIVRAIVLHYVLAYDHPFVDGNGRTARALFYWSVLKAGYWIFEYVSISKVIKEAPAKYGRAFLYAQTDDNDLTYFILHQLQVLLRSITDLETYLLSQKKKFDAFEALVKGQKFNYRQTSVLNEFVRQRIKTVTIKQHQLLNQVSYLTARHDLEGLVEKGLLSKKLRGRQAFYGLRRKAAERLQIEKLRM